MRLPGTFVALLCCSSLWAQAESEPEFEWFADLRFRLEQVEQSNALEDATAPTLRARGGVRTPEWSGFSALAEVEAVGAIGSEDYNSGSNGRTNFSAVLDPEDVEVNQAFLAYNRTNNYLKLGRQRMVLDNARFFGDVGWRQNQQTYDALTWMNTALAGQRFQYAYMTKARRFLSDEHPVGVIDMNGHLFNYRYERLNGDTFSAYAYLIDMNTPAVVGNSTKTFGARYVGSWPAGSATLLYHIEYADQSDYANGRDTNDADYLALELGARFSNEWVAKVGIERLGGDGVYGFQTPFGTNHAFNGYADLFAGGTPAVGLADTYLKLSVPVLGARVQLAAHDFSPDQGGRSLGTEIDLQIELRFDERFAAGVLFADYQADDFGVDTTKWAVWLQFKY